MSKFKPFELRRVDEALIRSIDPPPFTKSWHPHAHRDVHDATMEAIDKLDLKVTDQKFSLSNNGANMFGLLTVESRNGKQACVGERNSIAKIMSIGYCAVLNVIACLNVVADGDFIRLRKHTGRLEIAELKVMAFEAVGKVVDKVEALDNWHEELRSFELKPPTANRLVLKAMREGVLTPSKFNEFDELYFGRKEKAVYEKTLFGFHGALTQVIRDQNLLTNMARNKQIAKFIDKAKPKPKPAFIASGDGH